MDRGRKKFTHRVKVGERKKQKNKGVDMSIKDNLDKFKVEKGKNLKVTSRAGLGVIGLFAGQIGLFKCLGAGLRRSSGRPENKKSKTPFLLPLIENLGW